MERYFIHPYEARHAPRVAALMAEARRQRRDKCPLLSPGFYDPATATRIVQGEAHGVVALAEDGSLAGFLFAGHREHPLDPTWGAAIVADPDRWALAPGVSAATLARLYAAGFGSKAKGEIEHRVHCPAHDKDMLNAWFHLGFGLEQAYAVARLEDMEQEYPGPERLEIRRATSADGEILADLSPLIALTQAGPPVWAGAPASYLADLREGFRGLTTDPEAITVLLAFRDGRAVGYQVWFPVAAESISYLVPDEATDGAAELGAAATIPEERGTGVGRALTARGVSETRDAGFSVAFTDWRTTNPLSSAFWPARGFRPYLYRLVRRFDPLTAPVPPLPDSAG